MSSARTRLITDAGLAAAFLFILGAGFAGLFVPPTVNSEKRDLAPVPAVQHPFRIKPLLHQVEAYVNDHFGLREPLLSLKARWDAAVFRTSASASVILGRNGWLYYADEGSREDIERRSHLRPGDVERFAGMIAQRGDWLAGQGVAYRFVVPPDKHTIYPDFIPARLRGQGPSRFAPLAAALAGSPYFIDLAPALQQARDASARPVYYRTDTHWNGLGAHAGFLALARSLGRPQDAPFLGQDLAAAQPTGPADTDLAFMARLPGNEPDYEFALPGDPDCDVLRPLSLPVPDRTAKDFPATRTSCASGTGTLLLFHDSFGDGLMPYFARAYARTVFVPGYPDDATFALYVAAVRPDVVLEQRVERSMQLVPRAQLPETLARLGID